MKFDWLMAQVSRDDDVGLLARKAAGAPQLFTQAETWSDWINAICTLHARTNPRCADGLPDWSAPEWQMDAVRQAMAEAEGRPIRKRQAIGPAQRFNILKRDGYRCRLCGVCADDGATLEVDHKTPVCKGGTNEAANLWTLCFECNRGKHAKSL